MPTIAANPVYSNVDRSSWLSAENIGYKFQKSSLAGIRLRMPERQIQKILGQPLKRIVSFECGTDEIAELNYRDLKVQLYKDKGNFEVVRVETSSRRYRTDRGIHVGDKIDRAKVAYPSLILNKYARSSSWKSFKSGFEMDIDNRGKITKIALGLEDGC
jgi:hypothetical protein